MGAGENCEDRIRVELARQGIVMDERDLATVAKIVSAHRAGLERARAAVSGDPEVPHGFVPPPPPPPDGAAPETRD